MIFSMVGNLISVKEWDISGMCPKSQRFLCYFLLAHCILLFHYAPKCLALLMGFLMILSFWLFSISVRVGHMTNGCFAVCTSVKFRLSRTNFCILAFFNGAELCMMLCMWMWFTWHWHDVVLTPLLIALAVTNFVNGWFFYLSSLYFL